MEEFFKFIGGTTVALAVIGYVLKGLFKHLLDSDLAGYKAEIEHRNQRELEDHKHKLLLVTREYEAKISSLHAKRSEVIAELYTRLVAFMGAAQSFASLVEFKGELSKEEKLKVLDEKSQIFWEYYIHNRIYFSEGVCAKIQDLWDKILPAARKYSFWMQRKEVKDEYWEKMDKAWEEAYQVLQTDAPEILKAIEQEFRGLLGVIET